MNFSYKVYKDSKDNLYKALNGITNKIDYKSNDGSTVLARAINNAPAILNKYLIYLNGTITINYSVNGRSNLTLFGDGIDQTIVDYGNSANGQLYFNGKSNININNLTLKSHIGIGKDRTLFNYCDGITLDTIKINGGGKYFSNWALYFNTNNRNINLKNITTINTEDSPIRFYGTGSNTNSIIFIGNYTNLGNDNSKFYKFGNGDGIDLWGVQNITLDNIHIKNVTSNGIGIYYNAKNIKGREIYIDNVGNAPLPNRGHAINFERWNDVDPGYADACSKVLPYCGFNGVHVTNCHGHGFRLYTKPSNWNKYSGTITNIKLSNYKCDKTYWSAFSLDGGTIKNVLLDGFTISNTNQSNTGSSAINFDADKYSNVLIQNGTLIKPFIQSKSIPSGVIMKNIKNFIN